MSRRDDWNRRYAGKDLVWSAGPNRLLADELANATPGTALDVACGEGRNALWLAERGWTATGVDLSDVGIDKARLIAERRGVDVNWIVADVAEDELPAAAYDLVCVLYLHTGAEERSRWLPNTIQAVAPGGIFFYIGHDPSNIDHGVGGPQNPELLPGVDELEPLLDGFQIDTARVVERPVTADPGHGDPELTGVALDTFVRAIRSKAVS